MPDLQAVFARTTVALSDDRFASLEHRSLTFESSQKPLELDQMHRSLKMAVFEICWISTLILQRKVTTQKLWIIVWLGKQKVSDLPHRILETTSTCITGLARMLKFEPGDSQHTVLLPVLVFICWAGRHCSQPDSVSSQHLDLTN